MWQTFLHHLAHWRKILTANIHCKGLASLRDKASRVGLNRMVIHLISPLLAKHKRKGATSEKEHVTNLLMVELLKAMEDADHSEKISKAKEKFKLLMAGKEGKVSPNELEQVF